MDISPSRKKALGWLLAAFTALLLSSEPVTQLCALPEELTLSQGATTRFNLSWPITASIDQAQSVISGLSETLDDVTSVSLTGEETGQATVTFRLMGVLPVKKVAVSVGEARTVVPGGQSVGIAMTTRGVVVVGLSDPGGTVASPARLAGVRPGDVVTDVDGEALTSAADLSERVSAGRSVTLTIQRGGRALSVPVTPVQDGSGKSRLGLWVRDSTAGVGTLTFFDPESGVYGALGHAITDADTGVILPIDSGSLIESRITEIERGEKGKPGELIGRFGAASPVLGTIDANGSRGIYGKIDGKVVNALYPNGVPVMASGEVRPGRAQLLTTLDERGVRAYECEIVRLTDSESSERGFVVHVTDPELLARTGGIVQGMSGSPILQNGKLAGAVTHVFVSDPTQGYGIFIENMLDAAREKSAA